MTWRAQREVTDRIESSTHAALHAYSSSTGSSSLVARHVNIADPDVQSEKQNLKEWVQSLQPSETQPRPLRRTGEISGTYYLKRPG